MPFPLLPLIGSIGSALLGGRGRGRQEANQEQLMRDQLALRQAEFNRESPRIRARNAAQGDIMTGVQDFQLSGSGRDLSSTGGLRPSLLREDSARQVGQQLSREALLSAMGGSMKDPRYQRDYRGMGQDPYGEQRLTPQQKPGWIDKILGGLGIAGAIAPMIPGLGGGGGRPGIDTVGPDYLDPQYDWERYQR